MRKFRLLIVALLMGVVVGALEGCNRRELLDPSFTTQMNVKVDIRSLANVTCDVYNEKIPLPVIEPEMMRVLFYKPGTNIVAGESYISSVSTDGDGNRVLSGAVGVIPGTYELVIYNFDTRSTMIRNDNSRATIEAYTEPVVESIASRFNTRVDEATDILYQPDHLVVATNPREVIPYHEAVHTIEAVAESVVETFYIQIKVEGLEYVSSAQAVLTGMVGSNRFGLGERVTDKENAVYFTLVKSDDKGAPVLCNVFNTFGRIDGSKNDLWMTFDIHTIDGRVLTKEYDISHLFATDDFKLHRWLLFEEVLVIPPPPPAPPGQQGGGFQPSLEDWKEEHHDIIL